MRIEWFATQAMLTAAIRPAGAVAYAADTRRYHGRAAQWQPLPHLGAVLKALVAAAGPSPATLTVYGPLGLGGPEVAVPASVTLEFVDAGCLRFEQAEQLVVRGPLRAAPRQIFDYGGRGNQVRFEGAGRTPLLPEWWGALGDDQADDSVPIQRCLDSPSLLDHGNEIVFTSGKVYRIARPLFMGRRLDAGAKFWSYQVRGRGALLRADDSATFTGPAVQIGHGAFARLVDAGGQAAFPVAVLNVASLGPGLATRDFPVTGRIEGYVKDFGPFAFDYQGKTDSAFLNCTAAPGARVPPANALLEHALNVKLVDLDWQGLGIVRRLSTPDLGARRGIGMALALCDYGRFSHARVEGFATGIAYVEDGGNSNVFEQMRITGCRTGALIGGTPDGGAWRWIGGKVQQCEIGLLGGGATLTIADTDFSECSTNAIRLQGASEARVKFYSEGVAQGLLGTDGQDKQDAVLELVNCRAVVIEAARINGAAGTETNAAYGVRLRDCHGVRVSTSLFTRHQYADVRVEAGCTEVTIAADNQLTKTVLGDGGKLTQADKLRVDDRTGGRIQDLVRLRDLPRRYGVASASTTARNLLADPFLQDAAAWQLRTGDGAASMAPPFAGNVLAPDGHGRAAVVQLDTMLRLWPVQLPLLPTLTPNQTHLVLRYWWRAQPIRPGGAGPRTPRALRAYLQVGSGSRADIDWRRLDAAGVHTGEGGWQFEQIAFAPDRSAPLTELFFTASDQFGGEIDVALWGVQLFVTDEAAAHEAMVVP